MGWGGVGWRQPGRSSGERVASVVLLAAAKKKRYDIRKNDSSCIEGLGQLDSEHGTHNR